MMLYKKFYLCGRLQNARTQHSLKVIDCQKPTPFPSRREGTIRKSDSFDEEIYIFDICKGVCKTPLHKAIDYQDNQLCQRCEPHGQKL